MKIMRLAMTLCLALALWLLPGCGDEEPRGETRDGDGDVETVEETTEDTEHGNVVTAFYDPLFKDLVIYIVDKTGVVYTVAGEEFIPLATVDGPPPYAVSACFLPETETFPADYSIYIIDGVGGLHYLDGEETVFQTSLPGSGPYDLATFYDPTKDDIIVFVADAGGSVYFVWGEDCYDMDADVH